MEGSLVSCVQAGRGVDRLVLILEGRRLVLLHGDTYTHLDLGAVKKDEVMEPLDWIPLGPGPAHCYTHPTILHVTHSKIVLGYRQQAGCYDPRITKIGVTFFI